MRRLSQIVEQAMTMFEPDQLMDFEDTVYTEDWNRKEAWLYLVDEANEVKRNTGKMPSVYAVMESYREEISKR